MTAMTQVQHIPTPEEMETTFHFKVYIIESPKQHEIEGEIREGVCLNELLRIAHIECEYFLVADKTTFIGKINDIKSNPKNVNGKIVIPIIHFSLHGNEKCIGLTSNERFTWEELADLIRPVNEHYDKQLIIFMSSCNGSNARRMAHSVYKNIPYKALVGARNAIYWTDSITAFMVLYNCVVIQKINAGEGIPRMNNAIGKVNEYEIFSGKEEKNNFSSKVIAILKTFSFINRNKPKK